jgi:hypothetical protein
MRVLPLVILGGCAPTTASVFDIHDGDTDITLGIEDTDTETTDTETTVPLPDFDCYAMIVTDEYVDGLVELTRVTAFDSAFLRIHDEIHYGEYGGYPLDILDAVRDADGNVTVETFDEMGDGYLDYRAIRTYGVDNDILDETVDYNDDGSIDERRVFTWYGGLLVDVYLDNGDDGAVDAREVYTYDVDDRLLLAELDIGDDGSVDGVTTYTYLSPAPSIDVFIESDEDNDGYPEITYEVTYTVDQEVLTYLYDENADGEPEYIYNYNYGQDGTLDSIDGSISYEDPAYGLVEYDFVVTYTYDSEDRQINAFTEAFFNDFGVPYYTSDEAWDWTCP